MLEDPKQKPNIAELCTIIDAYYKVQHIDALHIDSLLSYMTKEEMLS
jgi:hypothetical protein